MEVTRFVRKDEIMRRLHTAVEPFCYDNYFNRTQNNKAAGA